MHHLWELEELAARGEQLPWGHQVACSSWRTSFGVHKWARGPGHLWESFRLLLSVVQGASLTFYRYIGWLLLPPEEGPAVR